GGTPIMPGTCRLASIKVSSAQLLFTSFVKKGKGIDRAASHHFTGQVEHRLFSPPEGRTDGRTCLHQTPFSSSQSQSRLGKRKKLMPAQHPTPQLHIFPRRCLFVIFLLRP
uniref:Uncharacterized protein n=1 Tax=Aegilops tauschii subsp. strangulata TaxID=200361 RepID=A0A453EAX1_AEGTS